MEGWVLEVDSAGGEPVTVLEATGVLVADGTGNTVKSDSIGVAVGGGGLSQSAASTSSFDEAVSEDIVRERLISLTVPSEQV
jgi:hypothetical protein